MKEKMLNANSLFIWVMVVWRNHPSLLLVPNARKVRRGFVLTDIDGVIARPCPLPKSIVVKVVSLSVISNSLVRRVGVNHIPLSVLVLPVVHLCKVGCGQVKSSKALKST